MTRVVNLVTGATGFVGSYLVEHLCARGEDVRVLVRKTSQVARLKNAGVELFYGDLLDPNSVRTSIQGIDIVYHVGEIGMRDKQAAGKNVAAIRAMIEMAKTAPQFKRLVFQSSLTVASVPATLPASEETPVHPQKAVCDYYSNYKREMEQVLAEAGLPVSIVRAGAIYGPGARFLVDFHRLCRKMRVPLPYPGKPDIRFSSIHVADLVAILHAAAHYQGEKYRVFHATDDNHGSVRDFLSAVYGRMDRPPRLWKMPYSIQLAGAKILDPFLALKLPGNNLTAIARYQGFNQDFSNRRIKEELGISLRYPTWREGMPETAQWLRAALSGK